ncbi:MAG: hypothetical protein ACSHX7_11205 [Luteolibacter sp.]
MNISMIRFPILAILLSGFACLSVSAQQEEKKEKGDSKRMVRVMYYGAPAGAPTSAFVYQKGLLSQEVILDRHNFIGSFEMSPEATKLVFLPGELAEDEQPPADAPSVSIPKTWQKVLLLVSADSKNKVLPIQMLPINASPGVFNPGEIYFMNFSKVTVFGMVGSKKLLCKPESKEIIKKPAADFTTYAVQLDSYKDSMENRRKLVRQNCNQNPNARVLTLILPLPPPRLVFLYSAPINDL